MYDPPTDHAGDVGSVLSGRYRLDSLIRSDRLTAVWRAHDMVLDRPVRVKLLQADVGESVGATFQEQAVAAARLSHPNIVPTFDAGSHDGLAYTVTASVEGRLLSEVLEDGPLPLPAALNVGVQVSDALEHAHRIGLLHHDIAPSHVVVVDDDYRIALDDFGLMSAVASTPAVADLADQGHQAPEERERNGSDGRSDLYATGKLVHSMACGGSHDPASCSTLPRNVVEVLSKATHAELDLRYQSAGALRADLDHHLSTLSNDRETPVIRRMRISPPVPPRPSMSATRTAEEPGATQAVPIAAAEAQDDTARHQAVSASPDATAAVAPVSPRTTFDAVRSEGEERGRRRRLITSMVVVAFVLAAIVLGRFVSGLVPDERASQATPPATAVAPVLTASSFDPSGDGRENESQVAALVDNDPATTWSTERYNTRSFGNLKPGVGVVLTPASASELRALRVESNGTGWSAQVYVADSARSTLAEWGQPVDTQSGLGGTANFDLHNAKGGAVLLWFTDLGSGNRLTISGVELNP